MNATFPTFVSTELWSWRLLLASNMAALLDNMALVGLTIALPIYVRGILGRTPSMAGFSLTAFIVGILSMGSITRPLCTALGMRNSPHARTFEPPLAASPLLLLDETSNLTFALAAIGNDGARNRAHHDHNAEARHAFSQAPNGSIIGTLRVGILASPAVWFIPLANSAAAEFRA